MSSTPRQAQQQISQVPSDLYKVAQRIAGYRKDFRLFAREQLKLRGQPFVFWSCQEPVVSIFERQLERQGFVRIAILKARQTGASTLAQGFVAWRTMLWPHQNAIVIADHAERSRTLFDIAKSFYEELDPEIRPRGRYVTKRELVFANPSKVSGRSDPGLRSRIVIDSAHKQNIALGASWNFVHLSECSRYKNPSFVLDGVIPALHRTQGTFAIFESSAEMAGVWWRDFCEASERGETGFEFFFIPYWLQPEYFICPVCQQHVCGDPQHEKLGFKRLDLTADERHVLAEYGPQGYRLGNIVWARAKLAELGNDVDLFRQNFPLCSSDAWVTPGVQAFPTKKLREQRKNIRPPKRIANVYPGPRILDDPNGHLWIWKEPEAGKSYDCGVDPSLGIGLDEGDTENQLRGVDASVICVIERGTNEQVAEWYSKYHDPIDLATVAYWLGKYYNTAQVAVEVNGVGASTNVQLAKLGYPALYIWKYRDEITPRYTRKTGWESNRRSKPWLIGFAVHELTNDRVIIRSELLLREMEQFVRKDASDWGAVSGAHDDRVFAFMIALVASDDENFGRYYQLSSDGGSSSGGSSSAGSSTTAAATTASRPEPWECDMKWSGLIRAKERMDAPWEDTWSVRLFH